MSENRKKELDRLIQEYKEYKVIRQMENYIQHGRTTTLKHCENVARISFQINETLKLHANERRLIEAAMLHDLFLYDWHIKDPNRKPHGLVHPDIACRNAVRYFHIPPEEQAIIRSHMWPLTIRRIPRSREVWIICIADKYCAVIETLPLPASRRARAT